MFVDFLAGCEQASRARSDGGNGAKRRKRGKTPIPSLIALLRHETRFNVEKGLTCSTRTS